MSCSCRYGFGVWVFWRCGWVERNIDKFAWKSTRLKLATYYTCVLTFSHFSKRLVFRRGKLHSNKLPHL